jgi:predicted class III extradiol MEMO1 family dioxygenase
MREIEKQDPDGFCKYLEVTKVPIDGKNVITIFLKILDTTDLQTTTKFLRYS